MERWRQYNQDYAIASDIVADLRNAGRLKQGEKIAVVSENQQHIPQLYRLFFMQFPVSAFLAGYMSAVPLLNRVSGFSLTSITNADLARLAQLPDDENSLIYKTFCDRAHTPWELRQKEDITLVCLPSMEGKRGAP
jgi:hypothetical protein